MAYKVRFAHSARADINHIVRYISSDNHEQAFRFARSLIEHAMSLAQFPERGRVVPEFAEESVREIVVRTYPIVYRVDHQTRSIEIIRFWHPARDTPELSM